MQDNRTASGWNHRTSGRRRDLFLYTGTASGKRYETDIITTHFDYHSIDHNLLKLDILGHDDPTMIRMLEDLTGIDAQQIPLDDQNGHVPVLNTSALGVEPEDIRRMSAGLSWNSGVWNRFCYPDVN